ncbi:MAG TPA: GNAT family N-acetyltransferase [Rhodanobacteraceae bacterium]|jgi:ribosomal protein S18 acetylase RimI-like enzyme|nr:GNAT family N-acetyltransferase [Rhodanobacteraceae bacterium]
MSTGGLRFRTATAADIDAIVALTQSAYRGDASRAGWTTEADLLDGQRTDPDEVATLIARDDVKLLLAERDGRLLASCVVERLSGEHAGDGYFGMFSVRPDAQGNGTGRALLAEAERVARDEWHAKAMRMTVIDVRAELIAWYERRGYHRTGEYRPFPYGDPRFGIPKRDDLRFEWLVKALAPE